ncbi:MAG: flippase-like domain-containing protein [Desulfobulbaceae bacterium]|nr:flippase-like domain-containing protein [Desulfobulbaceae bacterium]
MKRCVSIFVSLAILAIIYYRLDFERLVGVFIACDKNLLILSLGMVVPITLSTAWRLQFMAPKSVGLGIMESNRLILAASTLNMVLPSKMGDLAKAYFMKDKGRISGSLAFSLVVFEKGCDMLSLLFWCTLGLLMNLTEGPLFIIMSVCIGSGFLLGFLMLGSRRFSLFCFSVLKSIPLKKLSKKVQGLESGWVEMHTYFWSDVHRLVVTSVGSVGIWLLHLLQIWLFTLALNGDVPFLTSLALAPLAILAGLLPLTFAGIGTRDAALIYFFAGFLGVEGAAALGILCTSRYFIPAIAGLPFLQKYLETIRTVMRSKSNKAVGPI